MTTTFRMKYIIARKLLCHIENYCYSSDDAHVFLCLYVFARARARAHTHTDRHRDKCQQ